MRLLRVSSIFFCLYILVVQAYHVKDELIQLEGSIKRKTVSKLTNGVVKNVIIDTNSNIGLLELSKKAALKKKNKSKKKSKKKLLKKKNKSKKKSKKKLLKKKNKS